MKSREASKVLRDFAFLSRDNLMSYHVVYRHTKKILVFLLASGTFLNSIPRFFMGRNFSQFRISAAGLEFMTLSP
jgi:hypothetical protein